jgi:exopolyphosphatase/guanosine-5'-triphosphate,3'-diphosphate pyrophosphatase
MRVAAVDIGTNSVLLLIAERRDGGLAALVERASVTRLGQGVDASRALAPEAVHRTLECLRRYAIEIQAAGVSRVAAVGTSALRDAQGVDAFIASAAEILGVAPHVVSGDEEARLTFAGALTGLELPKGPVLVADVGGGSTELIAGNVANVAGAASVERGAPASPVLRAQKAQRAPRPPRAQRDSSPGAIPMRWSASLDIGSVRLTERYIRSDPIRADELAAVRVHVRGALANLHVENGERGLEGGGGGGGAAGRGAWVVGVAGTVTTLAALARGLASLTSPTPPMGTIMTNDRDPTHGTRLTIGEVGALIERLARLPLRERKALPGLDEARADIIVAGAVIVEEVLAWAEADVLITSDRGVRWGLAKRLVTA